jgi:hypothetical protein
LSIGILLLKSAAGRKAWLGLASVMRMAEGLRAHCGLLLWAAAILDGVRTGECSAAFASPL